MGNCNDCAAKQVAFFPNKGRKVLATDCDATLDTDDAEIHVFSDTSPIPVPPPNVVITLPCNPSIGERHRILAATASVTLDGNNFPIVDPGNLTPNNVPAGTCIDLTFTADPDLPVNCDCNGGTANGQWHVC